MYMHSLAQKSVNRSRRVKAADLFSLCVLLPVHKVSRVGQVANNYSKTVAKEIVCIFAFFSLWVICKKHLAGDK